MLLLKTYLVDSSSIYKDVSSYIDKDNYKIQVDNRKKLVVANDQIGCYSGISKFILDNTFAYNSNPFTITTKKTKIATSNIFNIVKKTDYSCAVTIFYGSESYHYSSTKLITKHFISLMFSGVKKTNCAVAKQQQNPDIVCLESSCKKITLCCNEKNYCNTPERFNLLGLVAYTHKNNENFNNSYTKYTDSRCQLTKKALDDTRYQECVAVTNSTYIAKEYTSITTLPTDKHIAKHKNSLIILAYILPPIGLVSLIITGFLVYKKLKKKQTNVEPQLSNNNAIELS
jgi:hypothetical protein